MHDVNEELQERMYVCPVCGKKFFLPLYVSKSDYVYTITVKDKKTRQKSRQKSRQKCCSYSCYRKATD